MRIGIDATALYGRYGGVEYSLWNLLVALHAQDKDNEYVVYVPRNGPPHARLKNTDAPLVPTHRFFHGGSFTGAQLPFPQRFSSEVLTATEMR